MKRYHRQGERSEEDVCDDEALRVAVASDADESGESGGGAADVARDARCEPKWRRRRPRVEFGRARSGSTRDLCT